MPFSDPASPFLNSVNDAVLLMRGPEARAHRNNGREHVSLSWFPTLPHGPLCGEDGNWDNIENWAGEEEPPVRLTVFDSGAVHIGPGDDDEIWIETTLRSGDELDDLMTFFETTKAKTIGASSGRPKELSSLIDEVYLLVPQSESDPELLPLRPGEFSREYREVADYVDAWLSGNGTLVDRRNGRKTPVSMPSSGQRSTAMESAPAEWNQVD